MKVHVRRLTPGTDLKATLDAWAKDADWSAAVILAVVGSLERAAIRFAGAPKAEVLQGPFEIVSLSGTLSAAAGSHLHISVADARGACVGGHLKEGALVHTTVEVAVGELRDVVFSREVDKTTGYFELVVNEGAR